MAHACAYLTNLILYSFGLQYGNIYNLLGYESPHSYCFSSNSILLHGVDCDLA